MDVRQTLVYRASMTLTYDHQGSDWDARQTKVRRTHVRIDFGQTISN